MILFLTLIYVAVLALLLKLRVVPLNLFWKLSPLLWMVLLFFVLFVPMQWGAPSGAVILYKPVIEVIPNVTGEVTSIEVAPREPMKKGDVIIAMEGKSVKDIYEYMNRLSEFKPGQRISIEVMRNDEKVILIVEL